MMLSYEIVCVLDGAQPGIHVFIHGVTISAKLKFTVASPMGIST